MIDYWNVQVEFDADVDIDLLQEIKILSSDLMSILNKEPALHEEMDKLEKLAEAYRSHKTINWLLELDEQLKLVQRLLKPISMKNVLLKTKLALIYECLKVEMIEMVVYFLDTLHVSWTSLVHTRTIWSVFFDYTIGNFIRIWARWKNIIENSDAIIYLTKRINHKDMLYMIANASAKEDVYAILKPYLKRYLSDKLKEELQRMDMPNQTEFDPVREKLLTYYPNAKKQYINQKTLTEPFIAYFIETIDDEQILRFSNRVSDVIMMYVDVLKRYTWISGNEKLGDAFLQYSIDELVKKYEKSHNERAKRKKSSEKQLKWEEEFTQKPWLYTTRVASSETKYLVQMPSMVVELVNEISGRAVGQEDECKRYLKRMWNKKQTIPLAWLWRYYNINIQQGDIDHLKQAGFFVKEYIAELPDNVLGDTVEEMPQKSHQTTEQSLVLLFSDTSLTSLDPEKVIDWYISQGYIIYKKNRILDWLYQFDQDQWEKSKTSSYNRLLKWAQPEYRSGGYWLSKKDWWSVMMLWSYRFVRYKHVLVAVWDHATYDEKLRKKRTISRKLIDSVLWFINEQEKGNE